VFEVLMQPLHGFRVVSLAVNVPGPVAAARLHALGAAVVKVEPPGGDPLAAFSPVYYDVLREGQEVVRLDLKGGEGRDALATLLAGCDLLLTATRPGALARLGLDWPPLHARFPCLCQVAIVGHPSPDADAPGHDLTYLAPTGLLSPPDLPRTLAADLAGAERAVSAALALLLARERGGEAGFAEVALAAAAESLADPLRHGLTAADGPVGGGFAPYGLYPTQDGWIALAALEPRFQDRLATELDLAVLDRGALGRIFRGRTAREWEAWAATRDLPIVRVRTED
jgi:crotonobetainyl-CoA:carnitine CoA-transferase CaiB-like acyl-CoA transferase